MRLNFVLLLLALGVFHACGDSDDDENFDYSVTIMSPDASDKLVGDSIHLHINFDEADLKTIHNISVKLINTADQTEVYSIDEHVHESSGHYEHHADVVLAVDANTEWLLEASVWPHHKEENEEGAHEAEHGEHGEEHIEGKVIQSLTFTVAG